VGVIKRSNGTGSVTKLTGKRRNPWMARITTGVSEEGEQLRRVVGYFKTKGEAEIALALESVMPTSEFSSYTLKQVYEMWKKTKRHKNLSDSTKDNYRAVFKNYMSEYHNRKFADLQPEHFQKMVDKAEQAGMSESTMTKIKALATILSDYASSKNIIPKSYVVNIVIPKAENKKDEKPIFYDTEIQILFKNDHLSLVDTILILIYSGFRPNELFGLKKDLVDLDEMLFVGGSKTEAGKDRIVPIHPKIQKYVIKRYNESEKYLLEWEKIIGSKKQGTLKTIRIPYKEDYYRYKYYETLDALGIERRVPYKARHTFFTKGDMYCKDERALADIGGHTDPAFSRKTYSHSDIERLRKAMNSIP
jgi:integrase